MSGRRTAIIGGGVIGAGALYYLYNAGGNPKVAEKQFEHDAARVSSSIKHDLPGKGRELKTQAKVYGQEGRAHVDSAVADARAKADKFDSKVLALADDAKHRLADAKAGAQNQFESAKKEVNSAVNQFDRKASQGFSDARDRVADSVASGASSVEDAANKQKSAGGLTSWFGGKK